MINQQNCLLRLPSLDIEVPVESSSAIPGQLNFEVWANEEILKAAEALCQQSQSALKALIEDGNREPILQCSYVFPFAEGRYYLSSMKGKKDSLTKTNSWKINLTYINIE